MKKQNLIWIIPILGLAILIYASIEVATDNREISNLNDKQVIENQISTEQPQIPQKNLLPRQYKPAPIRKQRTPPVQTQPVQKPPSKKQIPVYQIGDIIKVGYMIYQVEGAGWTDKLADGFGGYDYPDAAFLLVRLLARNEDKKARMIPPFHLIDETGAEYNTSSKGPVDTLDFLVSLNPGVSKTGLIIFDAPKEHNYLLKISGGYWSLEDAFVKIPRN